MGLSDLWQIVTNPQLWPFFLTFLSGYVMMNVFLGHGYIRKNFSELEKMIMAFGIGSLFEYLLFLPSLSLVDFWYPFLGANVYVVSAIIFCVVSVDALVFAIYGENTKTCVEGAKKILTGLTVPFSAFLLLSLTIGGTARAWYPDYIAILISNSWLSFIGLSLASFFLFLGGVFFLRVFVLRLPVRLSLTDQILGVLKSLRRRTILGICAAIITVLAISLLIVPMDMRFGWFTPHIQEGPEIFSSVMEVRQGNLTGHLKVVFINATRGAKDNISATYRYYALMSKSYNITTPSSLWLLSSFYVSNPSNTSFLIGEYNPSYPTSAEDWKKIYVALPDNVTYKPSFRGPPNANEVMGLTISFGNFSGESTFLTNLTYWQEINPIENVEIYYHNLTFTDLGNGTWMETHTIYIKNNSNDTLRIPALEYDRFIFPYVIRNSTCVYWNGNLQPWDELVSDKTLALNAFIYPQRESNITFTFLATENPY